jgi:hypothetical protein
MRGIHKAAAPGRCATAGCGCGGFRVRKPGASPAPPRVIQGRVERELTPGSKAEPDTADAVNRFARHLRGRMRALGWDAAALAKQSGLSERTVVRAVNGTYADIAAAEKLAELIGSSLAAMIGPYRCATCDGEPPKGYRCLECGTEARAA